MKKFFTTLLIFSLLGFHSLSAQGTLSDLENNIGSVGEGTGSGDLGLAIDAVFFMADWGYNLMFRFGNEVPTYLSPRNGGIGATAFPYADEGYGKFYFAGEGGKSFNGELRGNYFGESLELYGQSAHLRISPVTALNIDAKYMNFSEILQNGSEDNLQFYSGSITYNRIRRPKVTWYWGGGVAAINRDREYTNISFNTGVSWFVYKPISIHADFMATSFGGTPTFSGDLRLQYHVNRLFLYTGYQGLWLGDAEVTGLTAGLGVYF